MGCMDTIAMPGSRLQQWFPCRRPSHGQDHDPTCGVEISGTRQDVLVRSITIVDVGNLPSAFGNALLQRVRNCACASPRKKPAIADGLLCDNKLTENYSASIDLHSLAVQHS